MPQSQAKNEKLKNESNGEDEMNVFTAVRTALLAGALTLSAGTAALAEFPEQPIRIIVPTDPGGAIDSLARIFQRAFEENRILKAPVVVVNMPGAGGTVGTRAIKDAEPDGYTIGLWHNGLVTSAAMGVTDYDHSAFSLIGSTGFVQTGLGVQSEGRVASFEEMLAMAKQGDGNIKVAVNIGLPVHFIPLMVSEANGGGMRMVQAGGGAKRLASVLGGHTDTALFSVQELIKFQESGLKPVVVFARERVPELPEVPTAQEKGIDVMASDARIWLAPAGVPADRMKVLRDAFAAAMQNESVRSQLESFGITPSFVDEAELVAELNRVREEVKPLVAKVKEAAR